MSIKNWCIWGTVVVAYICLVVVAVRQGGSGLSGSLDSMIENGHYAFVSKGFAENRFSVQGRCYTAKGLRTVTLNRPATSDEARRAMQLLGLEPASLEMLLAYGAAHPLEQNEHRIVALGTSVKRADGQAVVPYLDGQNVRSLDLFLDTPHFWWHKSTAFLAIPKSDSAFLSMPDDQFTSCQALASAEQ